MRVAPPSSTAARSSSCSSRREHDDEPRPSLESHGSYIFGVLLVPVVVAEEDRVFYQEIDLVAHARHDHHGHEDAAKASALRHRAGARACPDPEQLSTGTSPTASSTRSPRASSTSSTRSTTRSTSSRTTSRSGRASRVRSRLSDLRHDLLHVRRTLAPTRDAIRKVVDNRVELDGEELFDRDLELSFADAYDKLLRATDGLELARDLAAGVRDYLQAKISNDQNEVMKRLTVIASVLLLPTFIVGLYGQNFDKHPRAALGLRLLVVVGLDRRDHDRPARLLPLEEVDLDCPVAT